MESGWVYYVSLPNTFRHFFDYLPNPLVGMLNVGSRVRVSFGKHERIGVVVGQGKPSGHFKQLKCIEHALDEAPLLSAHLLALCEWVSDYYHAPLSEILALALPKKYRLGHPTALPMSQSFQLTMEVALAYAYVPRQARRQQELIHFIEKQASIVSQKILTQAGFTAAQWKPLCEKGILSVIEQREKPLPLSGQRTAPLALNDEQKEAVSRISQQLGAYHCFLLHGVTGSGKTEVYLQVITQVLQKGQQVLVLVPEIGLTPQLLERFSARFHEPMVVIHSQLSDGERQQAWELARLNEVKLVIGTRAAIFTPLPSLGLIIVDEEHDTSFKQMEGVHYSARDTALMRAFMSKIPIVLGSATPSLESLHNCRLKKYTHLYLTQKALSTIPLHYRVIDMRKQTGEHGLALATRELIKTHLERNNQVLVFINRRGFSPVLLCQVCGWMADCRQCDSHLTLHRQDKCLICHHCGLVQKIPNTCQRCHDTKLVPVGVGTQRVEEYLREYFPTTALLRVDRDESRKKNALNAHLASIHEGKAQLIVGTQMLAKGHHFPRLNLVVILDADQGFYHHDFRALERLGQLLVQVAGRAGRATEGGEVAIQTLLPEHPLLNQLLQEGYESFADSLLSARAEAGWPPFQHLAVIRAQARQEKPVLAWLHAIKSFLQPHDVTLLGPAPAPLARKAAQHRMQLLIKSPSRKALHAALKQCRENFPVREKGVRWSIDVDPIDLA